MDSKGPPDDSHDRERRRKKERRKRSGSREERRRRKRSEEGRREKKRRREEPVSAWSRAAAPVASPEPQDKKWKYPPQYPGQPEPAYPVYPQYPVQPRPAPAGYPQYPGQPAEPLGYSQTPWLHHPVPREEHWPESDVDGEDEVELALLHASREDVAPRKLLKNCSFVWSSLDKDTLQALTTVAPQDPKPSVEAVNNEHLEHYTRIMTSLKPEPVDTALVSSWLSTNPEALPVGQVCRLLESGIMPPAGLRPLQVEQRKAGDAHVFLTSRVGGPILVPH